MDVKIANKLATLYCKKASLIKNSIEEKLYGVECADNNYIPKDIDLKIDILSFYNDMIDDMSTFYSKNNACLKKLLNEYTS
jgi:hypothetical protein